MQPWDAAVTNVPPNWTAMESGDNDTARYVKSAIGLNVVKILLTHTSVANEAAGPVAGWNRAVGFSLLGALRYSLCVTDP